MVLNEFRIKQSGKPVTDPEGAKGIMNEVAIHVKPVVVPEGCKGITNKVYNIAI